VEQFYNFKDTNNTFTYQLHAKKKYYTRIGLVCLTYRPNKGKVIGIYYAV